MSKINSMIFFSFSYFSYLIVATVRSIASAIIEVICRRIKIITVAAKLNDNDVGIRYSHGFENDIDNLEKL